VDLQLTGKAVLVTGGTKGIGRAVVDAFAAEGARVAFCARTAADVERAEAELRAGGAEAAGTALDVRDGAALASWVGAAAERFGGIDVVVANVSALAAGPDEETWRAMFEIDLLHTKRLVQDAVRFPVRFGQDCLTRSCGSFTGWRSHRLMPANEPFEALQTHNDGVRLRRRVCRRSCRPVDRSAVGNRNGQIEQPFIFGGANLLMWHRARQYADLTSRPTLTS